MHIYDPGYWHKYKSQGERTKPNIWVDKTHQRGYSTLNNERDLLKNKAKLRENNKGGAYHHPKADDSP